MAFRRAGRVDAFTLIELLITIAIIGVLITIMLPALQGAHRVAMAMVCPITYVAPDRTIWLTDPKGRFHMQACDERIVGHSPQWSPDGSRLAAEVEGGLAIIRPGSGHTRIIAWQCQHPFWLDHKTVIGWRWTTGQLWKIDADSGAMSLWKSLRTLGYPPGYIHAYRDPHWINGFVVAETESLSSPRTDVVLRGSEWHPKGVVWEDPGDNVEDQRPAVDPTGKYIAWVRSRAPGTGKARSVAIKPIDAPSSDAPTIIGDSYASVVFSDWTPEGMLLVTYLEQGAGAWQLGVMDLNGRLIQTINTPVGINPTPVHPQGAYDAKWRHYQRF